MATASFVNQYHEIRPARTDFPPQLELPPPEYIDGNHQDVFTAAVEELGLHGLEPVYRDGGLHLDAPEGYKFVMTGAFSVGPAGNDIDWGYGPSTDSYEQWRFSHRAQLDKLETQGMSREAAEQAVIDDDWDMPHWDKKVPELEFFHGTSLSLSYDGVEWGSLVNPDRPPRHHYSDDAPAHVTVGVTGFKTTWHEQAARFIQLPRSNTDRLLQQHLYGQPGIIPCWQSTYAAGNIHHLNIELVPLEEGEGDVHNLPEVRLWVPDKVRWSLYDKYPDLIDQMGDYNNRTDHGDAMRMFGEVAMLLGGASMNAFDAVAAKSDLVILEDPVFRDVPLDKLAELMEEVIKTHNNRVPTLDDRAVEREANKIKDLREKRRQMVVITDVHEGLHAAVRQFGQDDSWLESHVEYINRF